MQSIQTGSQKGLEFDAQHPGRALDLSRIASQGQISRRISRSRQILKLDNAVNVGAIGANLV